MANRRDPTTSSGDAAGVGRSSRGEKSKDTVGLLFIAKEAVINAVKCSAEVQKDHIHYFTVVHQCIHLILEH